jgi:Concanavalin A-like lectin/glucanases superfamily/Immunoglobulin domain/Immunoglobulin I-set domain
LHFDPKLQPSGHHESSNGWFPGNPTKHKKTLLMIKPFWRSMRRMTVPVLLLSGLHSVQADFASTLKALNPVGYWRLEETTTVPNNVATNSGSAGDLGTGYYLKDGTPGVIHPAPGALVASPNSAAIFTGGQYVTVPSKPSINPLGSFTVEAWIKPTSDPAGLTSPLSYAQAGDPRTGWFLYQNNGAGAGWDFRMFKNDHLSRALSITGGDVPTAGVWYLVAISFDAPANLVKVYVNGSVVASGSPVGYVPNQGGSLTIGARSDGSFGYDGSLDEVALYDHPLSAAVLTSHYQNGINSAPSQTYDSLVKAESPLLYYRLDEPAFDSSFPLPIAKNAGSWGTTADATYNFGTTPGKTGVVGGGFAANNKGVGLNGQSGSVIIPEGQALYTDTVTFTAWVKPNGTQSAFNSVLFQRDAAKATGFGFGDRNDLRLHWEDAEYDWIPNLPIPPDVWSFIAAVVTPTNTTLSVNGVSVSHNATHVQHDFSVSPINIGLDPTGGRVVKGTIDEVAIFDKALTAADLASLYAAAKIPAAIGVQPVSPSGSLFEGSSVSFSVVGVGSPTLTYSWLKGTSVVASGPNFGLTNLTVGDSGTYFAVVKNAYGSATSAPIVLTVVAGPPNIVIPPVNLSIYPGGIAHFSVSAAGSLPISYLWYQNGTALSGATNSSIVIPELGTTDAGDYSVVVTNPYGSVTNKASLTLLSFANTYSSQVLSSGAIAYWKLDETSGTVFADSVGGYNGSVNSTVTQGVAGPKPPTDTGFSGDNTGFQFNGATSDMTAPALNLTQSTLTLTAWFNPAVVQADWAGLLFCRGTQTAAAGIDFIPGGDLGYTWNNKDTTYNWKSGLTPAVGGWNFVALVVEANQATMYLDAGSGLQSAANTDVTHAPEPFDNVLHFGTDPSGNRLFQGVLDEVAIFDHALSAAEIQHLRDAGVTGKATQVPVTITKQPSGTETLEGTRLALTATATGSQPLTYQWQRNNQDIPGAVRSTYSIASLTVGDSGSYHLVVKQGGTTVTSSDATVVVHATPSYLNATNGLVLHLPFDSGYADTSGRANNGTAVGKPSIGTGKIGSGSLHYSTKVVGGSISEANFVELGTPSDLNIGPGVDFSVAFWIRFNGLPGDLPFISNTKNSYGDTGIDFAPSYNGGSWSWNLKETGTAGNSSGLYSPVPSNLNDGNWHSLVHVFHRTGNGVTYLDGLPVNQHDVSGLAASDFTVADQSWEIGQAGGGNYAEPGSFDMDDLGFWRRALTDYEARAIYIVGNGYGRSFDVPAPATVTLSIQQTGSSLSIGWTSGVLQSAPSPKGPWTTVPGAVAPSYTVTPPADGATVFYRASY